MLHVDSPYAPLLVPVTHPCWSLLRTLLVFVTPDHVAAYPRPPGLAAVANTSNTLS